MLLAAASRILPRARWKAFAVSPRTFLRWHQQLVRGKWTYPHRGAGRLPVFRETVDLILRLARENPMWGYLRIGGELLKLGIRVSATTIRSVLRRNGLGPAHRQDGPSWSQFLRSQAHAILAFDFFTMENGVASHPVCPIRHRAGVPARVRVLGVTGNPDLTWVTQQARNLAVEDRLRDIRFVIRDLQVLASVRRGAPERGRPGHQDADPDPESERLRGEMGEDGAPGVPRPHPDPWPAAPAPDSSGVRGPLQRGETPPGAEARLSVPTGPIASLGYDRHGLEARSVVRDDPRVLQGNGVTGYVYPSGRAGSAVGLNRGRSGDESSDVEGFRPIFVGERLLHWSVRREAGAHHEATAQRVPRLSTPDEQGHLCGL